MLIGEVEACWQRDKDCWVIAGFLLDPAVRFAVEALRAPILAPPSKKESDTDLSTDLKWTDEIAHTKINMAVEKNPLGLFSNWAYDLQR